MTRRFHDIFNADEETVLHWSDEVHMQERKREKIAYVSCLYLSSFILSIKKRGFVFGTAFKPPLAIPMGHNQTIHT